MYVIQTGKSNDDYDDDRLLLTNRMKIGICEQTIKRKLFVCVWQKIKKIRDFIQCMRTKTMGKIERGSSFVWSFHFPYGRVIYD